MSVRPIGPGLRFRILNRDDFACCYCGGRPPRFMLHVDHVVPRSRGGTNDPANLRTACQDCNLGKNCNDVRAPGDAALNAELLIRSVSAAGAECILRMAASDKPLIRYRKALATIEGVTVDSRGVPDYVTNERCIQTMIFRGLLAASGEGQWRLTDAARSLVAEQVCDLWHIASRTRGNSPQPLMRMIKKQHGVRFRRTRDGGGTP